MSQYRESHAQYDISRFLSRQLAQANTAVVTLASSIYTPGDGFQGIVKRIIVCNVSGSNASFSLYHDDDGSTFNSTTQLRNEHTVTAGSFYEAEVEWPVDSSGNIGASCGQASNPLTITLYGEESSVRAR